MVIFSMGCCRTLLLSNSFLGWQGHMRAKREGASAQVCHAWISFFIMAHLLPLLSLVAKMAEFNAVCGTADPHQGPVKCSVLHRASLPFPWYNRLPRCFGFTLFISLELCINLSRFWKISIVYFIPGE